MKHSYKVLEKIGQGTTSVVYGAIRREDGRKVALKIMRSGQVEATKHAEEEYKLLRRARHGSIVDAIDLQSVGGHAVLVLECFEGLQLTHAVRESPQGSLPEAEACMLSTLLLQAIEYLHRNKIVHCDIRPQNLLVSQNFGKLKLLDFGSAMDQSRGAGSSYTPPNKGHEVVCLAPEVVLGEQPTSSCDVWQLGLCLHFMLSGRLPQRRDKCEPVREAIRAVATQHVSLCAAHWQEVSHQVKAVLRQCLLIDKHERPKPAVLLKEVMWLRPALEPERWDEESRVCIKGQPNALLGGLEPVEPRGLEEGEHDLEATRSPSTVSAGTDPSTRGPIFQAKVSEVSEPLPEEPSSEVILLGPENERAIILVVNYAERTYKVRTSGGRIKVVASKDVRLV